MDLVVIIDLNKQVEGKISSIRDQRTEKQGNKRTAKKL